MHILRMVRSTPIFTRAWGHRYPRSVGPCAPKMPGSSRASIWNANVRYSASDGRIMSETLKLQTRLAYRQSWSTLSNAATLFSDTFQDATHCPSSPGSTLSSRVVTRPTTRLVVKASSRSLQQAMAGPDSRRQQPSARWRVERCCQTRSFWSDATVHAHADLATTTTTTTTTT